MNLSSARGWGHYFNECGAVFNAPQLARFKTVVWNSVSGDVLTPAQRQAFIDYFQNGGEFGACTVPASTRHIARADMSIS